MLKVCSGQVKVDKKVKHILIIRIKYVLFILLGAALGAIPGTWFQHYGYDKCCIILLFMASIGIILKIIEWLYK